MGRIKEHGRVKLVSGFIFAKEGDFEKAKPILEKRFGEIDFESEAIPFNLTDYYEKEFGKNLKRRFVSFKKLIAPQDLRRIKALTNRIENKLSRDNRRLVNIDPGYLDLSKLVLASTKDYKHRIYLDKGIYAEITLFYQNKTFKPWEWTYRDYKTPEYISVFNRIRELYDKQTKA